ncbi:MAG: esterase-like activity of phytase family protein [Comamonadaceae bacterium]|nr:esterase-like activity of phytase family protein [Burkholderiales bacterium]MEB2348367.1 esterase-like activity of phytase family protein [Comamonadaceae bacterium]
MKTPSARGHWRALAAVFVLLSGCTIPHAPPAPQLALAPHLRLIGVATLPWGTRHAGTAVGGLSGIAYSPERDEYLLISDDKGSDGPARVYTARIRYDAHHVEPPEFTGMHRPLLADGQPYAPWWAPRAGVDVPDAEAVRWLPGARAYVWSSEGDFARGFGPRLRIQRLDGAPVREVALPPRLTGPLDEDERGPRGNGTLEGLALAPDGRTAWVSMELPLKQDGASPTPTDPGAPVRITAMDLATGTPLRQIAYPLEAVPRRRLLPGPQLNGVSEILMDGNDHLLVLERSYSMAAGFGARLYRVDTRAGSDTRAIDALTAGNHQNVPKQLVGDLAALGIEPDNIEGMTWGPRLADGGCVLLFVSDDNFNLLQTTQFIAARYLQPPGGDGDCPATTP